MALVKKEIGELLVDNGLITADELKMVQQERLKTGEPISLILSRLGLANESHLKNALERQYGVSYISLAKTHIEPSALELLPETMMRQHQIVPICQEDKMLTVAMVNPNNLLALDDIKAMSKAQISDEAIVNQIEATGSVFHLTTNQISGLKDAGVSQRVIDAMINTGNS